MVELPEELSLDIRWECGLISLSYPRTWSNIVNNTIGYTDGDSKKITRSVEIGYYETIQDFLAAVVSVLNVGEDVSFHVTLSRNIIINLKKENARLYLTGDAAYMMGFEQQSSPIQNGTKSPYKYRLDRGINNLYVHCSVIRDQIVGGSTKRLLRTVPVKGKYGDITQLDFNPVIYLPLKNYNIRRISIEIEDSTGEPLPFESGQTVAVLHFKPQALL